MSIDCRERRVSALNLRHIDTLRITGPPTPHRRGTQVAGTSEQVVLLTRPTTKLPCQHPSTKGDAHKCASRCFMGGATSDPKHKLTTGAGRHSMWTLTVLRVLTPLGLESSSWRSCLARQSAVSPDPFKLTVIHFTCDAFFYNFVYYLLCKSKKSREI